MHEQSTIRASVKRIHSDGEKSDSDVLAVEEPLEIRLAYTREGTLVNRSISVTMRTPGHDFELAEGFLFTEGIVSSFHEIASIERVESKEGVKDSGNIVCVCLRDGVSVDLKRLERHFYTTSSCGVCGKASLEALKLHSMFPISPTRPVVSSALIHELPAILRAEQALFDSTGGLHASALFDAEGKLLLLREDVGRHNAVDKIIGAALAEDWIPLESRCLFVSGRTSFEIMQKALAAGIPLVAGVGAPSSLAVEIANTFHMTLLGFVRDNRFNIYSDPQRIRYSAEKSSCTGS